MPKQMTIMCITRDVGQDGDGQGGPQSSHRKGSFPPKGPKLHEMPQKEIVDCCY